MIVKNEISTLQREAKCVKGHSDVHIEALSLIFLISV